MIQSSQTGDLRHDAEAFYSEYDPLDVLGKGISSVVRRCLNRITGSEYAVKIIDLLADQAPTILEVQNEISLLKELRGGPNIIELYDVYETKTYVFLVFELMKCELFDHLNDVIRIDENETKEIIKNILTAINHLHSKRIIHRDIKLENILIDDNFNVKLTDFGFSTKVDENTKLRELFGTQIYMAPEVLKCGCGRNSEGYSFPADIWSCGILVSIMLTGSSPFYHRRELVMLRSIMEGRYSIDGPDWKGISILAKKFIQRLLTLDQHQRITAEEALQDEWFKEVPTNEIFDSPEIKIDQQDQRRLKARRRFRGLVYCVIMVQHLKQKLPIRVDKAKEEPYNIRPLRLFIDNAAFRVYGHWVKKHNSVQERNALFQRHLHRPYY